MRKIQKQKNRIKILQKMFRIMKCAELDRYLMLNTLHLVVNNG